MKQILLEHFCGDVTEIHGWNPYFITTHYHVPHTPIDMYVYDQEEYQFAQFETHLDVIFQIQVCNDFTKSQYSSQLKHTKYL